MLKNRHQKSHANAPFKGAAKFLIYMHTLTINHTVDYMAQGFMIFMRGIDITWGIDITRGIGRVLLKVEPVLGPEIARA